MFECRRRGVRVPRDVSIIGFDNLEIAAHTDPPLSALNVPAFQMGRESAEDIVRSKPGSPFVKKVELNVEFVERGTTGPPPSGKAR